MLYLEKHKILLGATIVFKLKIIEYFHKLRVFKAFSSGLMLSFESNLFVFGCNALGCSDVASVLIGKM